MTSFDLTYPIKCILAKVLHTLIEYSASNVNKENNSGMILDDIFNYQLEIIRKYFGILIDMEIGSKCEYTIFYQHLWFSNSLN